MWLWNENINFIIRILDDINFKFFLYLNLQSKLKKISSEYLRLKVDFFYVYSS